MSKTIKIRELRKVLKENDCIYVRTNGSHEIWATAKGKELPPIIGNKANADCWGPSLKTLIKFLNAEGINLRIPG